MRYVILIVGFVLIIIGTAIMIQGGPLSNEVGFLFTAFGAVINLMQLYFSMPLFPKKSSSSALPPDQNFPVSPPASPLSHGYSTAGRTWEFGGEVLRFVINFCIAVIVLSLLNLFGLITLQPAAHTHSLGDILLIPAVMALVFTSIEFLVSRLFSFQIICLIPISASSIVAFAALELAAHYVPAYMSISPNLWLVLLSGLLLGIRLPKSPILTETIWSAQSW